MESTEQISVVALRDFTITLVSMRDQQEFNRDSLAAEKGRGMYVYVRTNDRDATFTQLHKRGVNTTTPPRNWEWGNREFVVKDPDGYKICFWQPTNEER